MTLLPALVSMHLERIFQILNTCPLSNRFWQGDDVFPPIKNLHLVTELKWFPLYYIVPVHNTLLLFVLNQFLLFLRSNAPLPVFAILLLPPFARSF